MAKKSKKTKKLSPSKIGTRKTSPEIQGLGLLCFAVVLLLSLVSFATGQPNTNILGLTGHLFGKFTHALFGLSSYLICLFLGWIGWRLLFGKSINHLFAKASYFTLGLISACMLLSLIEDQFPSAAQWIGNGLYPAQWNYGQHYHLGGAPFYFLYRDIPNLNLFYMFNTLGIALVFSCSLAASILYFTKCSSLQLLYRLQWLFQRWIENRKNERILAPEIPIPSAPSRPFLGSEPSKPQEESDFLRFVKLRIPGMTSSSPTPNAPSQELLAIQPESNPKVRPSLSRKNEIEEPAHSLVVEKIAPAALPVPAPAPIKKREQALAAQRVYNGDFTGYQLPAPTLLTSPKKVDQTLLKKDLNGKRRS